MQTSKQPKAASETRSYWCFISYRHADNKEPGRQWATWLHQAIETYEVPQDLVGTVNDRGDTIPERIFPVFRDEEELPVDADLASPIYRALEASKFLVVICSPRAVASSYVDSEIRYFKQLGHAGRVLAVMIEGEPNASRDKGKPAQGFAPKDECFPEAMRHGVGPDGSLLSELSEPVAADFRLGSSQGWASPEAYRLALRKEGRLSAKDVDTQVEDFRRRCELMKLKVIAGILGVPLGTLTQRDKAYQLALAQKRARALRRWVVAVSVFAVLAVAGGGVALQQQQKAEAQRQKAVTTLSQSDFLQGVQLIKQGRDSDALAYLARAVRANPKNHAAMDRLYTALISQHSWFLPQTEPLRHGDAVNSASFSPDGTRIVTASDDKTARLWDAHTGKPIGQPMRHGDKVKTAFFSPDGNRVITASWDRTARLWDGHTGKQIGKPLRNIEAVGLAAWNASGAINSASFSADGARLLTVAYSSVQVWDARTGQPIGVLVRSSDHSDFSGADLSADGTRLVTAAEDDLAQLWDVSTGQPIGPPMGLPKRQENRVQTARFSPDGSRVVTASTDGTARLWDGHTGRPIGGPMRHESLVTTAVFSPDGARVITGAWDHTARLWDANTGQPIGAPMRHDGTVNAVSFSHDGTRVVTASADGTVRLWDAHSGLPIGEPMRQKNTVDMAEFSFDGKSVVAAAGNAAWLWNTHTGQVIGVPLRQQGYVFSASISPDGSRVATASWDHTARLWDAYTGQPVGEPMRHNDKVSLVSFSSDSTRVLTASDDKTARLWDAHTGKAIGAVLHHADRIGSAAFSPDGTRILTASDDKTVQLWDGHTGRPVGQPIRGKEGFEKAGFSPDGTRLLTIAGSTLRVWDAKGEHQIGPAIFQDVSINTGKFSSDGNRIVTASGNHTVRIWDARTGQPIGPPMRHEDVVGSASFSADGNRVVADAGDNTAYLWDAQTMQPMGEPMRHEQRVGSVSFSPDGTRIITASDDASARLWDGTSGQPIGEKLEHASSVISAAFSPDGTHVVTTSTDNTARLWDIFPPNDAVPPMWLADLAEAVGGEALSDSGSFEPVDADRFFKIKAGLADSASGDFWSIAGRWFFADRETRTISPLSTIKIGEYLARSPPYLGLGLSTTPRAPGAPAGLSVVSVVAQSPAMKAGLQAGDMVIGFNGKPLDKTSVLEFVGMVAANAVGSVVHVEILRQGVKKSIDATIEARP